MLIPSLVLVLLLAALEFRVTRRNIGTPYNGFGALEGTLCRATASPMRGRVLLAWVVGWMPHPYRLTAYQVAKWALCWGALALLGQLAGLAAMLMLGLLIACTFEFDYWEAYAELLGLLLCLTGQPGPVALGAVLWAMSRETVVLAPYLAWAAGGVPCAAAALSGPLARLLVLLWQGTPALYCERWTLRALNVPDLKAMVGRLDGGMVMSVLWTVATPIIVVVGPLPRPFGATAWAPLLWIVAGWTMGRARETRVFMPAAVWLAVGLTQM